MEISESLEYYIKQRISDCYKIINIVNIDNIMYSVMYISCEQWDDKSAPKFNYNSKSLNLRVEMRDNKIEELLNSIKVEISDFDIEEIIYTDEQRDRLKRLRSKPQLNKISELLKVKKEYSEKFTINQPVWYKGSPGIITFKHSDKSENDISRYSVKVKETEYRYVYGTELLIREIKDLSYIPIDKELNKLSTIKLLKMYKKRRDRNKGVGDLSIKRILQDREHIKIGEPKIVIK